METTKMRVSLSTFYVPFHPSTTELNKKTGTVVCFTQSLALYPILDR